VFERVLDGLVLTNEAVCRRTSLFGIVDESLLLSFVFLPHLRALLGEIICAIAFEFVCGHCCRRCEDWWQDSGCGKRSHQSRLSLVGQAWCMFLVSSYPTVSSYG
jgi:hypothetical protein